MIIMLREWDSKMNEGYGDINFDDETSIDPKFYYNISQFDYHNYSLIQLKSK